MLVYIGYQARCDYAEIVLSTMCMSVAAEVSVQNLHAYLLISICLCCCQHRSGVQMVLTTVHVCTEGAAVVLQPVTTTHTCISISFSHSCSSAVHQIFQDTEARNCVIYSKSEAK